MPTPKTLLEALEGFHALSPDCQLLVKEYVLLCAGVVNLEELSAGSREGILAFWVKHPVSRPVDE